MKPKYGEGCVPLPPGTQPTVVDAEGNRHVPAKRPPEPDAVQALMPKPLYHELANEVAELRRENAALREAGVAERRAPPDDKLGEIRAHGVPGAFARCTDCNRLDHMCARCLTIAWLVEEVERLQAGGPARKEPLEVLRLVVNLEADLAEYEKLAKQAYGPDTTAHAFRRAIEAARRALSSGLPAQEPKGFTCPHECVPGDVHPACPIHNQEEK